VPILF